MGHATKKRSHRWPDGIAPYRMVTAISSSPALKDKVESAIKHWNAKTCIRLVKRKSQNDYVTFRLADKDCTSPVGRQKGQQDIRCNLRSSEFTRRNLIHEIGHAVGLQHEHSRWDRDDHVVVHPAMLEPPKPNASDEEKTEQESNNVDYKTIAQKNSLLIGPYDCKSRMHYRTIAGKIVPKPGGCTRANMGKSSVLTEGDINTVHALYGFRRLNDSNKDAGYVSEIEAITAGKNKVLTAVRTKAGRQELIRWHVYDNGGIRRTGDSGTQGGHCSQISVAGRGTTFVTSCQTTSNRVKLISWKVPQDAKIRRLGDSGNNGDRATRIQLAAVGSGRFVTAFTTPAGRLRLVSWQLNGDNTISRRGDSGDSAGKVTEISLLRISNFGRLPRVVTVVRTKNNPRLRVIVWMLYQSGKSIGRLGDSAEQAYDYSKIDCITRGNILVTAARDNTTKRLKLISWRISEAGSKVTRLKDSSTAAGKILANGLAQKGNYLISAVKTTRKGLRLIGWRLHNSGKFERINDSHNQTGEIGALSICPKAVAPSGPMLTAVKTKTSDLKLISWSTEFIKQRVRINS